jgi:hypothetical protein
MEPCSDVGVTDERHSWAATRMTASAATATPMKAGRGLDMPVFEAATASASIGAWLSQKLRPASPDTSVEGADTEPTGVGAVTADGSGLDVDTGEDEGRAGAVVAVRAD